MGILDKIRKEYKITGCDMIKADVEVDKMLRRGCDFSSKHIGAEYGKRKVVKFFKE